MVSSDRCAQQRNRNACLALVLLGVDRLPKSSTLEPEGVGPRQFERPLEHAAGGPKGSPSSPPCFRIAKPGSKEAANCSRQVDGTAGFIA